MTAITRTTDQGQTVSEFTKRLPTTPLDRSKTVEHQSWRNGRWETWEATSADGRWRYVRLETSGTPWEVTDLTRVGEPDYKPDWFPSLLKARRWTAIEDAWRPTT